MKSAFYLLVAAAIVLLFLSLQETPLPSGQKAPLSTEVRSYDGQKWTLARLGGKPMVINFWATWCPPCVSELPVLDALSRQYANQIHFVGLAVDSPAQDVANMVKRFDISYPVAEVGHDVVEEWKAHSLPTTYVLDASGQIVWSQLGAVSQRSLGNALQDLLEGKLTKP